jgi:hypothetical protein
MIDMCIAGKTFAAGMFLQWTEDVKIVREEVRAVERSIEK